MFLSQYLYLARGTGRGDLFCMYKFAQKETEIISVMFVINSHDPAVMTSLSGDRKIARRFGRFFAQFGYEIKRTQYCYMPDS